MIETIVLDLDGPLLDGVDRHYECYRRLLHGMGFQPISKQDYWHLKRSRIDRRSLLALSRAEACYDQFLDGWLQRIETPEMLAFDRLQPEALEILRSCAAAEFSSCWQPCGTSGQTPSVNLKHCN